MKKIIGYLIGSLLTIAIVSVAYTGYKIENFQRQTESRLVPHDTSLSTNPRAFSTAEILDGISSPRRAFLDIDSNHLFTNAHVLQPVCEKMRGRICDGNTIRVKLAAESGKSHTRLIKRSYCVNWLDICAIESDGWNSFFDSTDFKWTPLEAPQIFALPRAEDNGAVNTLSGRLLQKGRIISILEIPTRKGSSGSPVFGNNGHVLGIATANAQDLNFINFLSFRAFWSKKSGLYSPITIVINYEALQNLASCLEHNENICTPVEQKLLIDLALDYADIGNSEDFSQEQKISFRRRFGPFLLQQIQRLDQSPNNKLACELTELERNVKIAVKFMEHLSSNRPPKKDLIKTLLDFKVCANSTEGTDLINKVLIHSGYNIN